MNRRTWILIAGLVLVLLVAATLRFYRLQSQDIWGDEAFSISLSSGSLSHLIAGGADTHPPLYPLLLYVWLRLAGNTAFATRALSALIGIVAVPLVFVLARRLMPSSLRFAWTAALLTAVSPLLVYYSQETRMYELVTVLSLASTYFAVALLDSESRGKNYMLAGYLLSTIAAAYTHYSAFFVIAAQDVVFVLLWVRGKRKGESPKGSEWIAGQVAIVLAYIPWILVQSGFLGGKANARYDEWSWRGLEMIFGKTLLAFGGGLTLDAPIIQVTGVAFLIMALLGTCSAIRSFGRWPWLAPLVVFIPVAIALIVNPIMPFFYERYVLVALPAFYLTVALGLEFVARFSRSAYQGITVALVLAGGLALSQYYFNDTYAKGKYGQMMTYVSSQARRGDALILNNPLQKPLYDYYRPKDISAFYLPDGAPLEDPATRSKLTEIASTHDRVWLVMFGNPREYDPTGYLERWLGANAFKSLARGYVDASLSLYVMPNSSVNTIHRNANVVWGQSIALTAYDIDLSGLTPGGAVRIALHWRAIGAIPRSLTVFTHLIGDWNPSTNSPIWAQMDGVPAGGSRPTNRWQEGETVDDQYGLALPADMPAGEYTIEIGMYDPGTMARVPVVDDSGVPLPDERLILETVEIK